MAAIRNEKTELSKMEKSTKISQKLLKKLKRLFPENKLIQQTTELHRVYGLNDGVTLRWTGDKIINGLQLASYDRMTDLLKKNVEIELSDFVSYRFEKIGFLISIKDVNN